MTETIKGLSRRKMLTATGAAAIAVISVLWPGCVSAGQEATPKPATVPAVYTVLMDPIWEHIPLELAANIKLVTVREPDYGQLYKKMKQRELDFALKEVGPNLYLMSSGTYALRDGGPFAIRGTMPSYGEAAAQLAGGFLVRKDSGISSPSDIEPGTRIADVSATFPAAMGLYQGLLAWAGLEKSDVRYVPFKTVAESVKAVAEDQADIAWGLPVSAYVVEAEASGTGIAWIQLNPNASPEDGEGARKFRQFAPTSAFLQNQVGVASARGMWGFGNADDLICHAEMDVDAVYRLIKFLVGGYDAYKTKIDTLFPRGWGLAGVRRGLDDAYAPLHEGAIRYYKEAGIWTAADDARQRYNLAVIDGYVKAYDEAIQNADAAGIEVDPSVDEWQTLWADTVAEKKLPGFRIMTDAEISAALESL